MLIFANSGSNIKCKLNSFNWYQFSPTGKYKWREWNQYMPVCTLPLTARCSLPAPWKMATTEAYAEPAAWTDNLSDSHGDWIVHLSPPDDKKRKDLHLPSIHLSSFLKCLPAIPFRVHSASATHSLSRSPHHLLTHPLYSLIHYTTHSTTHTLTHSPLIFTFHSLTVKCENKTCTSYVEVRMTLNPLTLSLLCTCTPKIEVRTVPCGSVGRATAVSTIPTTLHTRKMASSM